jgi:hypothetical protein
MQKTMDDQHIYKVAHTRHTIKGWEYVSHTVSHNLQFMTEREVKIFVSKHRTYKNAGYVTHCEAYDVKNDCIRPDIATSD